MENTLSLFNLLLILLVFSCNKTETKYEYSQVIVNNSDHDVKLRLIEYDQYAIQDSFNIESNQESIIHEAPFKDLICGPIGSIELTVIGDSLELQKDINNRNNWVENTENSTEEVMIKKCLFIFNNSDLE